MVLAPLAAVLPTLLFSPPTSMSVDLSNPTSQELTKICSAAAKSSIATFPQPAIPEEDIAIHLMVKPKGADRWVTGGFRSDFQMYPASVVKLYYLGMGGWLRERGRLKPSEEDLRGFRDMIVDSSNDGTGHVLDILTGTTGGPELSPRALRSWMEKRQGVNRWLRTMEIQDVNACQKTWNEGPYGRERQGYGKDYQLRNMASPASAGLMMAAIADGRCGEGPVQEWMMGLLKRSLEKPDGQTRTYIGKVTPKSWTHFSKAGNAYQVRHDTALLMSPEGHKVVLTIFTDHHSTNLLLLPHIASEVLKGLEILPPQDEAWAQVLSVEDDS
jgi:hypothetical protein